MRYEVEIILKQVFHGAVDAESSADAQAVAMNRIGDWQPEHQEFTVVVDKGVDGTANGG